MTRPLLTIILNIPNEFSNKMYKFLIRLGIKFIIKN
jgi:hypothetical protein